MMLHWVQLCALWLLPLSTLGTLTVHIVPHTHDDVGWLKTVDEYFSGSNDTIQHAGVRNILNSVVTSLQKNSKRKFTYVEQAFFQRWWRELNENTRNVTKTLVKNRQLNFANGGWCMHDEAATHYVDMVDQTTLGHRLLKEAFGDDGIVTIGWQLDPFGHSASIFGMCGYEFTDEELKAEILDALIRQQKEASQMCYVTGDDKAKEPQTFVDQGRLEEPQIIEWQCMANTEELRAFCQKLQDFNVVLQERVDSWAQVAKEQQKELEESVRQKAKFLNIIRDFEATNKSLVDVRETSQRARAVLEGVMTEASTKDQEECIYV